MAATTGTTCAVFGAAEKEDAAINGDCWVGVTVPDEAETLVEESARLAPRR